MSREDTICCTVSLECGLSTIRLGWDRVISKMLTTISGTRELEVARSWSMDGLVTHLSISIWCPLESAIHFFRCLFSMSLTAKFSSLAKRPCLVLWLASTARNMSESMWFLFWCQNCDKYHQNMLADRMKAMRCYQIVASSLNHSKCLKSRLATNTETKIKH